MSSATENLSTAQEYARAKLHRRLNWRILPILMVCYFFANLDRQNISFAKLYMQSDLGFTDAIYGLGAGIFFIGYVLFEIPSNLVFPKIGARRTMSRILLLWGITSAAMMFVRNVPTFYALRFLLGVFEAGFGPGLLFYLTYWYPEDRMARAVSIVLMAGPISGIIGGPLSAALMTSLHGVWGLSGWQWMFLFEGLPCIGLAAVVWLTLADRPQTAKWLSASEREIILEEVKPPVPKHPSFLSVAGDPRIYLMSAAYFCVICGIYTLNFWLPTILKAGGVTDVLSIGLFSAVPYVTAIVGMRFAGWSSDRSRERRWHSAVPALVGAVCLAVATARVSDFKMSLMFISLASMMMYSAYAVFWSIPSEYLKGDVAAGGIALINTIGLLGGFVSPTLIGWATSVTGSLHAGLYMMVALLSIGGILLGITRTTRTLDRASGVSSA